MTGTAPRGEPRMKILRADITTLKVDVIVNAANSQLIGGGGVDGAIHRAAGPELLAACKQIGGCPTGDVRVTPGFRLPAHWVFHTVGPRWHGGTKDEPALLASCYRRVIELAAEYQVQSIAVPAISCGIYRYPPDQAAEIAVTTISWMLASCAVEEVIFAILDPTVAQAYAEALARHA